MFSWSDTSISADVDLTYSSSGSATVTVQSNGYGGNGFMEGQGGGAQRSPSQTAQITAPAYLDPASEVSAFYDWQTNYVLNGAPPRTGGRFTVTLLGHGPNGTMAAGEGYSGSSVQESITGFSDGCYYVGSPYPQLHRTDGPGSTWLVSGNAYGYDFIAAPSGWVSTYAGTTTYCGESATQSMHIVRLGNPPDYSVHGAGVAFTPTVDGTSAPYAVRDLASSGGQYP